MEGFSDYFKENLVDLLNCNLQNHVFTDDDVLNIWNDLNFYIDSHKNQNYYQPHPTLESWYGPGDGVFPDVHTHHKHLLKLIKKYNVTQTLDCGAGSGMITKYILADNEDKDMKLTCIEGHSKHLGQMLENFQSRTHVITPDIKVDAKILQGNLTKIDLQDNSQEFVFSCTVIMHIPFIAAIASIVEMTRVSSKYVCHIENPNDVLSAVIRGQTRMPHQGLCIDYKKLYKKLGLDIIHYESAPHPENPGCNFVYIVAEKK